MLRSGMLAVLLWLAAALLPILLFSNYHLFQLTMVVVYAIAILGLAILTGFNGQISLGHGAFYAIGAYVTAVLMYQYDVPYWATLPVSAVVCAAVGFLIGLPALRLGGLHPRESLITRPAATARSASAITSTTRPSKASPRRRSQ